MCRYSCPRSAIRRLAWTSPCTIACAARTTFLHCASIRSKTWNITRRRCCGRSVWGFLPSAAGGPEKRGETFCSIHKIAPSSRGRGPAAEALPLRRAHLSRAGELGRFVGMHLQRSRVVGQVCSSGRGRTFCRSPARCHGGTAADRGRGAGEDEKQGLGVRDQGLGVRG